MSSTDTEWQCAFCKPPDFTVHGFHTHNKLDVRRVDGSIHEGVSYWGWDVYDKESWTDVTHWRPHKASAPDAP